MRRFVPVLSCLFGLAACGAASGPLSGEWAYSDEVVELDSCGLGYSPTSGTFFIENHGDGTFTVDPNDSTDIFDCTYQGASFECPERYVEDLEFFGANARIDVEATGKLGSARSGSGVQLATASCKDQACENIAAAAGLTTPCLVEVSYRMDWVR